jgi:Family of unknown function (DUF5675)
MTTPLTLLLTRTWLTDESTIGTVYIDAVEQCYSLELPVKDGLPGSAIPRGTYKVITTYSPKFKRNMPLIVDIPNRSDIRIHWGNTAADTDGCILVGTTHPGPDFIGDSRAAFDALYGNLLPAAVSGDCFITIVD